MAQHSNYAKDRDLMMEAYASVQGRIVPKTASTALPRGYVLTEAHCDEESSESVKIGGKLYEVGSPDPNNGELIISIEKSVNGYLITTGQFSSPEDFVTKGPDSAVEAGGYALDLEGQPIDEDDLLTDHEIKLIDVDVSNGMSREELEAEYSSKLIADYIADGEAKGKFEGEMEDNEQREGATHKYTVIENDKEGSIQPMEYRQPEGDLIKTVKSGGMVKKCYQHPEGREWAVESDRPIDFNQEGSWTWDEDAEQREGATNEFPDGEGKYEVASVGGMHGQSIMGGKKFNSLQAACDAAGADIKDCYEDVDGWIDMEGDGTTLEFMVDEDTAIVMHKNVPAEDGSCASH